MIVTSPQEQIIASPPRTERLPSALKTSKIVSSESIAERVKVHQGHKNPPETAQEPELSIAEGVAARRRTKEQATPVLDFKTGKLHEYRQLLWHPNSRKHGRRQHLTSLED